MYLQAIRPYQPTHATASTPRFGEELKPLTKDTTQAELIDFLKSFEGCSAADKEPKIKELLQFIATSTIEVTQPLTDKGSAKVAFIKLNGTLPMALFYYEAHVYTPGIGESIPHYIIKLQLDENKSLSYTRRFDLPQESSLQLESAQANYTGRSYYSSERSKNIHLMDVTETIALAEQTMTNLMESQLGFTLPKA